MFLSLNFCIAYILVPMELLPDFLSFLEPFVIKAPALQLASFSGAEQNLIQILFVATIVPVGIVTIVLAALNQVEA